MKKYKILNRLKKANSICLLGHSTPDADALCSMVVFKHFLQNHFKIKNVDIYAESTFIGDIYEPIVQNENLNPDIKNFEYVITLDTSNPTLLGCYQQIFDSAKHKIVIDHHKTNLEYGDVNIIDVCSSTCELIFKILKEFNFKFSSTDYAKLYAGILTDTNNLTVGALSEESFKIAGACYKHCKGQEIYKHFFSNNTYRSQLMFAKAIQNSKQYNNGKIIISKISKEEAEAFKAEKDDYTGIINRLAQTRDVDLVCFIYPKTSKYYVSLRAKQGYDASRIAKDHGGGGHLGAAAFETDLDIEEIQQIILSEFIREIQTKNISYSKNPFIN